MIANETLASSQAVVSRLAAVAEASRIRHPVTIWAACGAGWLALAAYVWGAWIFSPYFRPVPVGNDPLPGNVLFTVRLAETISAVGGVWMLWRFVFGPLIRKRDIPVDGLLLLNFVLLWWADPIDNYVNYSFMYNGHAVNMGSWAVFIPGLGYPNQENFPEPLLMMCGFYLVYFLLTTILGCWIMRVVRERWLGLGAGWGIMAVFAAMAAMNIVTENLILRTGMAAYPGLIRSMSIFPGKVYQWPLYEAGIMGFVSTGFVLLRYYRDDKGQLFVEKGLDRLRLSTPKKRLVTFLALAGFMQPFFVVGYFLPYNLFAIHADTFPAYPSYLRTQVCGEGTDYACPSRQWVPIPRRDGKLFVRPDDPRLPQEVRDAQGISKTGDPYARK